ncbi:FtsB family cell division protein [Georgenia sp. Z1344]|uniref:FtsB family cell division protein n=1 Tax=Georgenia sp. Z1344 TaxID=3416706 RepID=UPI003CFA5DC6
MSRPPAAPRKPGAPRSSAARGARSRPTGRTRPSADRASRPTTTGRGRDGDAGRTRAGGSRGSSTPPSPGSGGGSRGNRRLAIATSDGDRPILSLRALALVLTLLVAFAIIAPTARHALLQAEQLRTAEDALAAAEEEEQRLTDELALWDDPEYVQSQARERLGYTMPGQTPFVVVDPEAVTGGRPVEEVEEAAREEAIAASRPWYLNLQESVEEAGAIPGADATEGEEGQDVPEPELPPEVPSDQEIPSGETVPD